VTICVANDNCPDYTWGLNEEQTRQAFADVVKGHLDEMQRTDGQPAENRDRYNAAVTQELLCFLEQYPDRKDELIRRVKEGRLYVSPYLCNSLWALQSFEGAVRTFYPARRLEGEWGIRIRYAHHIELPSLPWGHATILAGCGFRGLTVPYYGYDSTFPSLKNPPVFLHEGPDGSRVVVVLDQWASQKASYMQGASLLNKTGDDCRRVAAALCGTGSEVSDPLDPGQRHPWRHQLAQRRPGARLRRTDYRLQRAAGPASEVDQRDGGPIPGDGGARASSEAVAPGRFVAASGMLGICGRSAWPSTWRTCVRAIARCWLPSRCWRWLPAVSPS